MNNVSKKILSQTNKIKDKEKEEKKSLDAPPLDFSYKNIRDLSELKFSIEPRTGKRKPMIIEIEDSKNDKKKDENVKPPDDPKKLLLDKEKEEKQSGQQVTTEQIPPEGENAGQNNENQKNEEKINENEEKDKEKEKKDENANPGQPQQPVQQQKKGPEIVRIIPQNNIAHTIATYNIPLYNSNSKNPGKNSEDLKYSQKKVVKIKLICTSLILSYNQIRTIENFYQTIDLVMYDCQNLGWIDLSHNYLVSLNYDFNPKDFPNLRTLYLHCNYIKDMSEICKLQGCRNLKSLTIHGNPIDTIPNFRIYIIGMLTQLKTIDTVLISKKEKDNAYVWLNSFKYNRFPETKNPTKPPEITIPQTDQMKGN